MDKSIPAGAALILGALLKRESGGNYDEVFGQPEAGFSKPLTQWRVVDILASQPAWGKRWGSSACGGYQFIRPTLAGLAVRLAIGAEIFTPGLQDRLAFKLLSDRGYRAFKAGSISPTTFGGRLAMEWASFPVLVKMKGAHRVVARGETYYAGDALNRAGIKPADVELLLAKALAAKD